MSNFDNSHSRIAELVFKYLVNQLSDAEKAELDNWITSSDKNRDEFHRLLDRQRLKVKLERYNEINTKGIWDKITKASVVAMLPVVLKKNRWVYGVAAATIPIIIICGWLYYKPHSQAETLHTAFANKDVLPGKDRATLTLSDGSTIILDEAKDGSLVNQGNTSVTKHAGQIVYNSKSSNIENEYGYNSISTPRGGQYHINLADGSRVFLNAASSLSFPVAFNGAERRVKVTGEAYFEIAKNPSKPFIVVIDGPEKKAEVEVLGTHFNVNAYLNEPSIQTTLLEGKVKVKTSPSNTKILSPGQQAQVLSSGAINLKQVDTLAAVAWKNGVFRFGETDVRAVLRQIERWYDVEIIYRGEIPDIDFVGQISKYSNASKVLELLEMTGGVRFQVNGKKIFVLPP